MIIYIDNDYKCHITDDGTMRKIETDAFNDKCDAFIEGYRFVPAGETWVRDDGVAFSGEMVTAWKPFTELEKAQAAWEHEQLAIVTAERDSLLEYIEEEEFTTDDNGNRYHKEVGTDGEIHLVLIESYTGELFQ